MNIKKNITKYFKFYLLLFIGILLIACKNQTNLKEQFNETDNWIVLDKTKAKTNKNSYTWNFNVENPVSHVVQIVLDDTIEISNTTGRLTFEKNTIQAPLTKNFTINANQIVSEFKKTIKFDQAGEHTITLETEANFKQIRIIPHFKTPVGSKKYNEEWLKMHESPEKQAALKTFKENKFGMFIHWGLYSQLGGIWKNVKIHDSPYPGPKVAEWIMHAFRISREEYKELAKTFNPDKSFAHNIAKLAKDTGMKYVVITSKHHDGFALFDSKCSEYDMVDAAAYKADAVKELYEACLEEGLDFGVYYSHGNDWMNGTDGNYANMRKRNDSLGIYTHPSGKNLWDPSDNTHEEYLQAKAYPQIKELINLLPKLQLIWFDGEGFVNEDQSFNFYKMVYNINPHILVNRRVGWGFGDYEDAGDNKIPSADDTSTKYWETCGTTNNSWGYNSYDHDWKTTQELLYYFVDILSKGGNYLLNIGPDGKGHVPDQSAAGLREMGKWIHTNSDAVYGTTRWTTTSEGQKETLLDGTSHREAKGFKRTFTSKDFWFTAKENKVYAISLVKACGTITIRSFNNDIGTIKAVKILGIENPVDWKQTKAGLIVSLDKITTNENGFAVEITLE